MVVSISVRPTTNDFDAPFHSFYRADGSLSMSRKFEEDWVAEDGEVITYVPHAVVFVDGVMSELDLRNREGRSMEDLIGG